MAPKSPSTPEAAHGSEEHASKSVVHRAVRGAPYLIGIQILAKISTFVLNILIARVVSKDVFGITQAQFHVLLTSLTFLTREAIRLTAIRADFEKEDVLAILDSDNGETAKNEKEAKRIHNAHRKLKIIVGVTWFCLLFIFPLLCAFGLPLFKMKLADLPEHLQDDAAFASSVFVCGIMLELLSEPAAILVQVCVLMNVRMATELVGIFTRTILTFLLVTVSEQPLLGFALGQVAYGLVLCIAYYGYWYTHIGHLGILGPSNIVYWWTRHRSGDTTKTFRAFMTLSFEKYFLTEGESIFLVSLYNTGEQGTFSIVQNVGSIVARFVLQPIEETSRTVFSKVMGEELKQERHSASKKEVLEAWNSPRRQRHVYHYLQMLLRLTSILGLIIVTFGPSYAKLGFHVLYGDKWSHDTEAGNLLRHYCVFLFACCINGVLEAYVHGTAPPFVLQSLNRLLLLFTAVYWCAAIGFTHYFGPVGLIYANVVNFTMRILHAIYFTYEYYSEVVNIRKLLPSTKTFVALACGGLSVTLSHHFVYDEDSRELWTMSNFQHIGIGAVSFVASMVYIVLYAEPGILAAVRGLRGSAPHKKED